MEVNEYIEQYSFLKYINEDKSHYTPAADLGFIDPDNLFLCDESLATETRHYGGFLLNINPENKFINTHLFCQMADYYRKNKCYTVYAEDSIPYRQLRKREEYRRKNGFSAPCLLTPEGVKEIRITGSHYNFLNYTLMEQLDEKTIKSGNNANSAQKHYDFSKFIDAQFWTFHIMEFCQNNGFHLLIDKTRRGGFSYIMAADSANDLNLLPRKVGIHVAIDKNYLTKKGGLTDFTINNLTFFENRTMFKRGIISLDKENFKLGFKQPNGQEDPRSWGSGLISVSAANNPDCAIGKDAKKVKVEEVSTMDNFDEFMNVTEPAMRTGAYVTGTMFCWGTSTTGDMQTFASNFYDPAAFNFMPFVNVWDKDCRNEVCGYFKPYCWGLQGEIDGKKAMDKDGNSNLELGLRIAYKERAAKKASAKTFAEYINYLGQYANEPNESFNSTTENMFTSEALINWETRLKNDDLFKKLYVDGTIFIDGVNIFNDKTNKLETLTINPNTKVEFKSNERIHAEGGKYLKDYFDYIIGVPRKSHEDPHGCIRQWCPPIKVEYVDKNGIVRKGIPPGQYSATYDPVGVNKDKKEVTLKHSHNSIKIWENPTKYNGFKTRLACSYFGRPNKLAEADIIFLGLCLLYNCIDETGEGTAAVEINRGETVSNFKKWKATKYLMKDPVWLWDATLKGKLSNSYGISVGDTGIKLEGLRALKEMLYTVVGKNDDGEDIYLFQSIYDYQSIVEIKIWNNLGNFDRVSEMLLRGIQWKAKNYDAAKQLEHRKKIDSETKKSIFDKPIY